jgi:DNA-binding response OmpR family regulator
VLPWPAEEAHRRELTGLGIPRLLVIDHATAPPDCVDPLEDWVRLPADERDIEARLRALRTRASAAGSSNRPELDGNGRLLRGDRWVALSPTEEQLCSVLIDDFGAVVSDRRLLTLAWPEGSGTPTGLRLQMTRLRRRIAALQLEVRSVRGRGYVLQHQLTGRAAE